MNTKPYQWMALSLIVGTVLWAYAKDRENEKDSAALRTEVSHPRIERGSVLTLTLQTSLSSETSRVGDPVKAVLAADAYEDGKVALTKGTEVYGEVTRSLPAASSGDKRGRLSFVFSEIEGPGGQIPVTLSVLSSDIHESQADRTARTRTQLAGTAIGAFLGANIAANEHKNRLKSGLIGGAAGLAVGSLIAHEQGVDVELPSGSRIKVRVDSAISVQ